MSKKKNKQKAGEVKKPMPIIDTTAVVHDDDTATTDSAAAAAEVTEGSTNTAYTQSEINGWITYAAIIVEDGKPKSILDIRMPSFPEIRLGDLNEDERKAVLENTGSIFEMKDAVDYVHNIFQEKMDTWKSVYGSVSAALRARRVPETFRNTV